MDGGGGGGGSGVAVPSAHCLSPRGSGGWGGGVICGCAPFFFQVLGGEKQMLLNVILLLD